MKCRVVSGIVLTLLFIGMTTLAFNIQPVRASGTIYIRADGSVEGTDKIVSVDNVTYTFTDNIYESIVVERSNIIIDGAGYTLQAFAESGISLAGRNNVKIQNMKIETSENGIHLFESSSNKIVGNNISNNWYGIWLDSSSNNSIVGNFLMANKDCGVYLYSSSNNNISENEFVDDGLIVGQSYGNKVSENFVNGKPLIYLENVADYVVENAGQVILINCSGIRVENLNICNTVIGVDLERTNNTKISGNNIAGTKLDGILLSSSLNNSIYGNNISNNWFCGLMLYSSLNNSVIGNYIADNPYGIWLSMSSNNTFRNNNLIDNRFNFYLRDLNFKAWSPTHFVNDVDVSNTVNGKPIYYWVKKQDAIVPSDAGYVVLVNCTNIAVKNLSLEDNGQGMLLAFTENSAIRQNNIANNRGGIWLYKSSSNSVVGNNITTNWYGIALFASSNNRVYHNNLRDNGVWDQAWDDPDIPPSTNVWDDGYASGGNYWSDYSVRYPLVKDEYQGENQDVLGSDGMWDSPYEIDDDNQDRYPLVEPWSPLPRTVGELKTEIEELGLQGEIDNRGIVKSLITKLNTVQKLVDKGKVDEAKSILAEDFIPQVQNLSGIHITPEAADILIQSAEYILSHL